MATRDVATRDMTLHDIAATRARFTLPLGTRRRLVETGQIDPVRYRRELVDYVREVDPIVRACADWRPGDVEGSHVPYGCSVTYKDTIDVAGYPTRLGIPGGFRLYPKRSAEIVQRMTRHGLTCAGKAAVTQCALGSQRPGSNPVFPHLSASGSSTGSAAGVAAGFADVSVGTDSGGSLRWPAIYCGATALRLTPHAELLTGVHTVSPSMESVGLITRTPADLAWLWRAHRLGVAFDAEPIPMRGPLRIGVSIPPGDTLHAEMTGMLRGVTGALAGHGHAVSDLPLRQAWETRRRAWQLLSREAHDGFSYLLDREDVDLDADTRLAIAAGASVDDAQYAWLRRLQRRMVTGMTELLTRDVDLLLVPLEAGLPDRAERRYDSTLPGEGTAAVDLGMTILASFARLPVLAVPVGLSRDGSPLGLQVMARPGAEELLVSAGELLAELTPGVGAAFDDAAGSPGGPRRGTVREAS